MWPPRCRRRSPCGKKDGLVCPLATTPVTLVDPAAPEVEPLYAACAAAGVPRVKIGFFPFKPGDDYWGLVDAARRTLAGFARVGERYGVQTVYQVHSGPVLGSNCAGLMHLLRASTPAGWARTPISGTWCSTVRITPWAWR